MNLILEVTRVQLDLKEYVDVCLFQIYPLVFLGEIYFFSFLLALISLFSVMDVP